MYSFARQFLARIVDTLPESGSVHLGREVGAQHPRIARFVRI